jgi:hypothetical protein
MAINVLSSDALLERLEQKRSDLGGQGVNQFRASLERSKSDLLEHYIRPHLLSPDQFYIYLAENNRGERGRPNFDPLNSIKAEGFRGDVDRLQESSTKPQKKATIIGNHSARIFGRERYKPDASSVFRQLT